MATEAFLMSPLGSIPLRNSVLTIGRSPNNGLFINHATVSRHHAEVRPDGQGYCIVDLGSTSGTFLNGERLASQMPRSLHAGDILQVGSIPLAYQEKRSAVPLDAMATIPFTGTPAPRTQPGSGADHQPMYNGGVAVPDILSLSPVSDGLLHVTDVPPAYQPEKQERKTLSESGPDFSRETLPEDGETETAGRNEPNALSEPPVLKQVEPATTDSAGSTAHLPLNLAEKQLQFTAFYPRVVPVESWHTLLVYAHLEAVLAAVREDARTLQHAQHPEISSQTAHLLTEGTQITVVPLFQGVTFQPERSSFTWTDTWHPVPFRFTSERRWVGATGTGEVILLAGPLIIASLRISLHFTEPGTQAESEQEEVSAARYKNIFASYSPDDAVVVQALRRTSRALGDESFFDIEALRSSQNWPGTLPRAIESADVFQLFWSSNAAQSQCVYQECQYALQHYKYEGFMRPVYWEKPLAFSPPELAHLPFTYYEFPGESK